MSQTYTSANTSINKGKLPAVYSKVDFEAMARLLNVRTILDYGCGKYNNGKEYIEGMGLEWLGYDPYNRTEEENREACTCVSDVVICSNVLNVIDSEEAIQAIVDSLTGMEIPYFFTIYEGNGSGIGCPTKGDCYQRNEKTKDYLRFFPETAVVKKGVITNAPELLK